MKKVPDTTESDPLAMLLEASVRGSGGAMIEAQERRGQRDAVNSDQLPTQGLVGPEDRKVWEAMGIEILAEENKTKSDNLFTFVNLPPGWKKVPTDHSMWNNLVDDKGRIRGSFFYKAAFYDRDASIHPVRRFSIERNYERKDRDDVIEMQVCDSKKPIWSIDAPMPKKPDGSRDYKVSEEVETTLRKTCMQWLVDNGYPDFNNVLAYWD